MTSTCHHCEEEEGHGTALAGVLPGVGGTAPPSPATRHRRELDPREAIIEAMLRDQ